MAPAATASARVEPTPMPPVVTTGWTEHVGVVTRTVAPRVDPSLGTVTVNPGQVSAVSSRVPP